MPGKSPNINVELLIVLKTLPKPITFELASKISTESSSNNLWSDSVTILKLLDDILVTVFGVCFTAVL